MQSIKQTKVTEETKQQCLDILWVSKTHLQGCREKEVGGGVMVYAFGRDRWQSKGQCGSDDFRVTEVVCEGIGVSEKMMKVRLRVG